MTTAYRGRRWHDARAHALTRARHRCERCGARAVLAVHHVDGHGMDGTAAYDPANLRVLCHPCHAREHGAKPRRD